MKNIICTAMLLLSCINLFAQNSEKEIIPKNSETEKIPRNYLGFNLRGNFSNSTVKTNSTSELIISASSFYGYRVRSFVFGMGIGFGYTKSKKPYNIYSSATFETEIARLLMITPTIRYYSKFNVFITASYIAGKGNGILSTPYYTFNNNFRGVTYLDQNYTSNNLGWDVGIGYAIKAGKYFLIEPTISYQSIKIDREYSYNPTDLKNYYNQQGFYVPTLLKYSFKESKTYANFQFGIGTIYRF